MNADQNNHVWNSPKVVEKYASAESLYKPELTIFNILKDRLPHMRMLDLGIGGGRTSIHFEPLVKEYVGTDFSEQMVEASRRRLIHAKPNTRFEVVDATSMTSLPDGHFDFVLFSYNGLDCVAPENRDKVFQQVARVMKTGGYFAFSSHNIRYIPKMYRIRLRKTWRESLYQFYRIIMMVRYNGLPGKYKSHRHAFIRNGVEHFKLNTYYVDPRHQVQHLHERGFSNTRVYSLHSGLEISHDQLGHLENDAWLYYLSEISKTRVVNQA